MISIFSATNRADSYSLKVARIYQEILETNGVSCQLYDMQLLPRDVAFSETYGNRTEEFGEALLKFVDNVDKYVFVIPEYNGGFPGILKLFVDATPPKYLKNKKAGLIGVSSGKAGSLRGMDQFTNILNYLKVSVMAQKPKLSSIESHLNGEYKLINDTYVKWLEEHALEFVKF